MATGQIAAERIKQLNERDRVDGDYTLYWMQQSQRSELNHALEFAIQRANENGDRLLVAFAITADYPEANRRHYHFMLEGLQQVASTLNRRKIRFVLKIGDPPQVILALADKASEVICDRGYLRHQRQWREKVAGNAPCRVWQVESDTIVPVDVASDKREYAARTIRSQINQSAKEFLHDLATTSLDKDSRRLPVDGEDFSQPQSLLDRLKIDRSVQPCSEFTGGTSQAKAHLKNFIDQRLSSYDERNDLLGEHVSYLSPYLHFGQISPVSIALEIQSVRGHRKDNKESFLEELLVRRELAINFVYYEKDYDKLKCLPDWARTTLDEHEDDPREHRYSATQLESAQTHDPAWNAAMIEMKHRGYLHNHLRMYWGKKIIQWTNTTGHAYRTALKLNNRYFLDGRDPNSYANVMWLFGLHDRAHQERKIFGKVRYMSFAGLKRKCDIDSYISKIARKYDTPIKGATEDHDEE